MIFLLAAAVAAVAALLFGAAIAAPVALCLWWINSEVKWKGQPRKKPDASFDEQREIEALTNVLIEHKESRESTYRIGDEAGIPRRGDNLFDGRYGAGRDVNKQLERLDSTIVELNCDLLEKQNLISIRVTDWTNARANTLGSRAGIAIYVSLFAAISATAPPWAASIGKLTDLFGVTLSDTTAVWFGSSAAAAIAAALVLLAVTASTKASQ